MAQGSASERRGPRHDTERPRGLTLREGSRRQDKRCVGLVREGPGKVGCRGPGPGRGRGSCLLGTEFQFGTMRKPWRPRWPRDGHTALGRCSTPRTVRANWGAPCPASRAARATAAGTLPGARGPESHPQPLQRGEGPAAGHPPSLRELGPAREEGGLLGEGRGEVLVRVDVIMSFITFRCTFTTVERSLTLKMQGWRCPSDPKSRTRQPRTAGGPRVCPTAWGPERKADVQSPPAPARNTHTRVCVHTGTHTKHVSSHTRAHVCACTHMLTYKTREHTHAHMCVHTCAHARTHMRTQYTHARTCMCTQDTRAHTQHMITRAHVCARACAQCTHMLTCKTHERTHVCAPMCAHPCTPTHTHAHIQDVSAHMHTHVHARAYTGHTCTCIRTHAHTSMCTAHTCAHTCARTLMHTHGGWGPCSVCGTGKRLALP